MRQPMCRRPGARQGGGPEGPSGDGQRHSAVGGTWDGQRHSVWAAPGMANAIIYYLLFIIDDYYYL